MVANAHAKFESSCVFKKLTRLAASLPSAAKSSSSSVVWFYAANAHAVFESSCALSLLAICFTSLPNATNSFQSQWCTFANAHVVFARPCALNSSSRRSVSRGKVASSLSSD
eukprot:gnl/TRDRNA2_/TRDRNA2_47539_c1_seq1.p1 gnl/TRDRNA2_/TRDRNA2_47539_c1~~gnl/TRDRNA2_/TRDRNA2_47539_c1_seq1.p1  ORF type:complete len:112 (-),score=6.77 gnl/TRDRNA2_/TRDRNA2_47539_c1_seq1:28-363(-)